MNRNIFSPGKIGNKPKSDRNKKFLVFFLAFVMVSSVFGVIFYGFNEGQSNRFEYEDYIFIQRQGEFHTKVDNDNVIFNYLPNELNINLSSDIKSRLNNLIEIDLTSDYENSYSEYIALAQHQMSLSLVNKNLFIRAGFVGETDFNVPIITCLDATPSVPVVYFLEANQTNVYLGNNCIMAEGKDGQDFLKIKDALLYHIVGILR